MILYKNAPIGDIDEKAGIVKGYGSIFGNRDSDDDVIERGAYTKTIQENGSRVRYLWQHDITKPIGKMTELYEDEKGLAFVAEVPKTTLGRDALELMKYGVINENSVGILPIVKDWHEEEKTRYIKEVKLYEVSAVTLASNDRAMINEVKSEEKRKEDLQKKFEAITKLLKEGKISDELGYAVEYQLQCLKSEITKPTEEVTLPKNENTSDEVFKFMYNKLKI
jgi:HK97 family phage prohead protease